MDASPVEGSASVNEKEDPALLTAKDSGYDLGSDTSQLQTGCVELSQGKDCRKVVSCSAINEGAGPSNWQPASETSYDEKTPERQIFKTNYTRQDENSRSLSDSAMSCRREVRPSSPPRSERIRKIATVTPPRSMYELYFRMDSSDDESDGERNIGKYRKNFQKLFGPNESPEDSCLNFKIYNSKDHSSWELIDGISCLYLSGANRPSTENDPGRTHSSEEKEPAKYDIVNVPDVVPEKSNLMSKFDPETGEKLPVRRELFPKSCQTYSKIEQKSILNPPNNCSKPSTSLHKRKANEHGPSPEYDFQDEAFSGKSQEIVPGRLIQKSTVSERPTKKGRLSVELRQEKTSENIASTTLAKHNDQFETKQGTSGLLSAPGQRSRKSISPSKRKAEELCTNSETDSSEECRKRTKLKLPADNDDKDNSTQRF